MLDRAPSNASNAGSSGAEPTDSLTRGLTTYAAGVSRSNAASVLASAVLVLLAGLLATPASYAATGVGGREAGPLRVLVIGDSVTSGSAGDWTWRYRLWQHLAAGTGEVDFVGPYDDVYDNIADQPGSLAYNDPAFDTDHASRWGLTLAFPVNAIGDLVSTHMPDVVVAMLGVNDLTFLQRTPEDVASSVRGFVTDARAADPAVDLVLVHQVQSWYPGVPRLNELVDDLAVELDTVDSRVTVAPAEVGFAQTQDTWDPAHPNARGELVIAASVADALSGIGLALPYPRPLPDVPLGPRQAPVLAGDARDGGLSLTWSGPPGADKEVVWVRDVTTGAAWRQVATVPEPMSGPYVVDGLVNGHTYAARLQPAKGYWAAEDDAASNVVTLRPLPPPPGRVTLSSVDSPRRDRVRVVGAPATGATRYRLDYAPLRSCAQAPVVLGRHVRDLARPQVSITVRTRVVRVRLVAINMAGAGPASTTGRCVRVR